MILLDTQVLVWSSLGDIRLGREARRLLEDALPTTGLLMSPVSAWEIAMLVAKGRLTLTVSVEAWIDRAAVAHRLAWRPLTPAMAIDAGSLPGDIHGDPGDRMVIATARTLGVPLLTSDRTILAYAAGGHLKAIDARH